MLITDELSEAQKKIVRHICYIQLESLRRIAIGEQLCDRKVTNTLIQMNVSEEEFDEVLKDKLSKFESLHKDPNKLSQMPADELSRFRHLLQNLQEYYNQNYPNAMSNLWRRLFFIEELQNTMVSN